MVVLQGRGFELFRVYEMTSVDTSSVSDFVAPSEGLDPLSTTVAITKAGVVSASATAPYGITGGAVGFKDVTLEIDGVEIGTASSLIMGSKDCSSGTITVTVTPSSTTGGEYKELRLNAEGYEKI